MPPRLPKASATSHSFVRLVAFLLFALALVVVLFLHQPQTNADVGQDRATQSAQDKYPEKTFWVRFTSDPVAVLTLGLVVVGAAQAILFVWQLSLIHTSLADTKKAAKAAKRQARLARDSLIAGNRAWIKAKIGIGSYPLSFGDDQVHLQLSIVIENVGNAPAMNVNPNVWLLILRGDKDIFAEHYQEIERCKILPTFYAINLFQNEKYVSDPINGRAELSVSVSREAVETAIRSHGPHNPANEYAFFYIGGCVTYNNVTNATERSLTVFFYQLRNKHGQGFRPADGWVRPEDMRVEKLDWNRGNYVT